MNMVNGLKTEMPKLDVACKDKDPPCNRVHVAMQPGGLFEGVSQMLEDIAANWEALHGSLKILYRESIGTFSGLCFISCGSQSSLRVPA